MISSWSEAIMNAIQSPEESEIDREAFDAEKSAYWQARFKAFSPAELKAIYGE